RVGAEFRDRILALGDSRDPMDLFVSFMGREPRPDALLERQGLAA
ncbi:MAG TPA: M3 family metallopeptidase, partial [Polyangiaceae bacterium]|nr:M3 family metallopeptidase [Polyangiaceae bacterium]